LKQDIRAFDASLATDPITGLPGRDALIHLARRALDRQAGMKGLTAVMIVEFGGVRHVYQNAGYRDGDRVLKEAGQRIAACLPATGRVGWTLHQFVILLWDLDSVGAARAVAEAVVAALAKPFGPPGHRFYLYSNVGLRVIGDQPDEALELEELARQVDLAVPREAEGHRNEIRIFDEDIGAAVERRGILDRELRTAAERGELQLLYQPRVRVDTGEIVGAEALMRWESRRLGTVSPEEFVPLAEHTGYIYALTRWALKTACLEALRWQSPDRPPVRVGLNFTPGMFSLPDLNDRICAALEATGLPPECLEIEITEHAFMETREQTIEALDALRGLGIRIALDDFGTGFSAMGYLGRLPLDGMKIDRVFVADLPASPVANGIARAVGMLAESCGLESIAEGVEREAQVTALKVLGCGYAQGFYYSPPVEGKALRELIRQGVTLPAAVAAR
jgi:predicted signal transduction protein with EAL and GGDEF domain